MRRLYVAAALVALAVVAPSRAAYVVAGGAADRNAFINLLNAESAGGAWSLNMGGDLVFTAAMGNPPLNFFASRLNTFNNLLNTNMQTRTVNVGSNLAGVLVGAFDGNGVQTLDLADILQFAVNAAVQPQPLLDTRASVLIHELGELFIDGPPANFPNAHLFGGIQEENSQLAAQGIRGMRQPGPDNFMLVGAAVAGVQNFVLQVPFLTVNNVPAAGPLPAIPAGTPYFEVIRGRITGGPNFAITNIRKGIFDLGVSYDGTGYDIAIDSIGYQIVPEPGTILLTATGLVGLLAVGRRNRRAKAA
jgi:hypothetical protein